MRQTLVIHSRLSWRQVRGAAAIERQHGLQALAIEHVAARLAGGFLQPINPDSLKEAIGEAIAMDLGEFNDIKTLPGFPRAAAATLQKAWTAGLKFTDLAKTSDALVRSRIDAVTLLEAEVLKRLPPSMRRPADLVDLALQRLRHAKTLFGAIHVLGRAEMSPVWRPFLAALKDVTDVQWVAGPRQVPAWVRELGIAVIETAPEQPAIQSESCASPRHEALEAMRWARALLASGRAKPEEIAIAAASPTEWDDHFQALSEMAGIDLHFVHGRKALSTPEGQLAAALAEVLLRGFSQARMTRLIALLRSQNPDFKIVPGDWWHALPEDAPLLDAASWRDVLPAMSNPADANSKAVVRALTNLTETLAFGLKRAGEIGGILLRGRSLAIWKRALTGGPPEALDVTLASLALPDQVAQEANIIWAPAASLAADPRPWVRLVGLTSRAWPRHQAEDALLPNHIVNSSLLDPLPVHQAVRQALAQRYPRVLVDEFQDTDPLQAEILWRLCGEGAQGAPWTERKLRAGSLFVVGDPKQAVYRFRGADVDTYLAAKRAILEQDPDAVLEIVANFRSLKEIIDFANDQFRGLLSPENGQPGFTALQPTRLARDERPAVACFDVTIGDDQKNDEGKIVVDRVRREEARIVADLVSGLIGTYQVWDKRSKAMRPCRAGDIALLAPTGTNLWIYERALEQRDISIASQAGKSFY